MNTPNVYRSVRLYRNRILHNVLQMPIDILKLIDKYSLQGNDVVSQLHSAERLLERTEDRLDTACDKLKAVKKRQKSYKTNYPESIKDCKKKVDFYENKIIQCRTRVSYLEDYAQRKEIERAKNKMRQWFENHRKGHKIFGFDNQYEYRLYERKLLKTIRQIYYKVKRIDGIFYSDIVEFFDIPRETDRLNGRIACCDGYCDGTNCLISSFLALPKEGGRVRKQHLQSARFRHRNNVNPNWFSSPSSSDSDSDTSSTEMLMYQIQSINLNE